MTFDEMFYLMGDEDTDVGVHCRVCDTGGLPVVFYTTDTNVTGYQSAAVVVVHTISDMMKAGSDHQATHAD